MFGYQVCQGDRLPVGAASVRDNDGWCLAQQWSVSAVQQLLCSAVPCGRNSDPGPLCCGASNGRALFIFPLPSPILQHPFLQGFPFENSFSPSFFVNVWRYSPSLSTFCSIVLNILFQNMVGDSGSFKIRGGVKLCDPHFRIILTLISASSPDRLPP